MIDQYRHYLISIRRSQSTIRLRVGYAKQIIEAFPSLSKVKPQHLEGWVYSHPQWKPETINAAISSARSLFSWAHRYGLIADNPSRELETVRVPKSPRPIVPDVVLLRALDAATLLADKAIIMLGGEDGLRRSEIASLHTRHRTGDVLAVTGKGNKTRFVKMSPELCAVLDAMADGKPGFYFPGRFGGHVDPSTIYRATERLLRFNTHAMRHRAITSVYRDGGKDVFLTQRFAGHSSADTTSVYVHLEPDALVVASEAARLQNARPLAA